MIDKAERNKMRACAVFLGEPAATELRRVLDSHDECDAQLEMYVGENSSVTERQIQSEALLLDETQKCSRLEARVAELEARLESVQRVAAGADIEAESAKWERAAKWLAGGLCRSIGRGYRKSVDFWIAEAMRNAGAPQAQEDRCGSEQDDEDTYRDRKAQEEVHG